MSIIIVLKTKSHKYELNSKVYKFSFLKDKDKDNYCIL